MVISIWQDLPKPPNKFRQVYFFALNGFMALSNLIPEILINAEFNRVLCLSEGTDLYSRSESSAIAAHLCYDETLQHKISLQLSKQYLSLVNSQNSQIDLRQFYYSQICYYNWPRLWIQPYVRNRYTLSSQKYVDSVPSFITLWGFVFSVNK